MAWSRIGRRCDNRRPLRQAPKPIVVPMINMPPTHTAASGYRRHQSAIPGREFASSERLKARAAPPASEARDPSALSQLEPASTARGTAVFQRNQPCTLNALVGAQGSTKCNNRISQRL